MAQPAKAVLWVDDEAELLEPHRMFLRDKGSLAALRELQSRHRGSFLHGGVTPEECILPVSLLTPRR